MGGEITVRRLVGGKKKRKQPKGKKLWRLSGEVEEILEGTKCPPHVLARLLLVLSNLPEEFPSRVCFFSKVIKHIPAKARPSKQHPGKHKQKEQCHQITLPRYSLDRDRTGSIPVGVVHDGIEGLIHPLPENNGWDCPRGKSKRL